MLWDHAGPKQNDEDIFSGLILNTAIFNVLEEKGLWQVNKNRN